MKTKAGYKSPSQLQIGAGLTKYALRAALRNKAGFFFSLIFPLTFVFVFGMIGSGRPSIRLGVSSQVQESRDSFTFGLLKGIAEHEHAPVSFVTADDSTLRDELRRGKISGILEPASDGSHGFRLLTLTTPSDAKLAAQSFVQRATAEMSLRAADITPQFQVQQEEIPAAATGRYIDFALPGQIGFSMLSLATFGVGYSLSTLRKTLVLKRMMATTVKPLTFVVAQCLSRSVQALIQTAIIILVGVLFFHFTLTHGIFSAAEMVFLAFCGIMAFLGYGIFLSNIARDDQTLPVVLNLFNLPQVLLAGVFFPIDAMPTWVQWIGGNLPLAYLNISLRKAALEGASLFELWPYILGMAVWAVVAYVAAARTFHTE